MHRLGGPGQNCASEALGGAYAEKRIWLIVGFVECYLLPGYFVWKFIPAVGIESRTQRVSIEDGIQLRNVNSSAITAKGSPGAFKEYL